MAQSHSRLHLVDILAAGAGGAERLPGDVIGIDLYIDVIIYERGNEY